MQIVSLRRKLAWTVWAFCLGKIREKKNIINSSSAQFTHVFFRHFFILKFNLFLVDDHVAYTKAI